MRWYRKVGGCQKRSEQNLSRYTESKYSDWSLSFACSLHGSCAIRDVLKSCAEIIYSVRLKELQCGQKTVKWWALNVSESLFLQFVQAQIGRFGNICKSVPIQGWQNHVCKVAGAGQGHKCRPSRSLISPQINYNFSQGQALTLMNCHCRS